jgi:signal transduction histidine kinase
VSSFEGTSLGGRKLARSQRRLLPRDLDLVCAIGAALILEVEALTSHHREGPLVVNAVAVAVMTLAAIWRRRAPLLFLLVVGVASGVLHAGLTSTSSEYATLTGLYTVLVPTYAVGAWEGRSRALVGVLIFVVGVIGGSAVWHTSFGTLAPALLTGIAAWTAGRVMYAQRSLASEFEEKLAQLSAGRVERQRLAVSTERMRIARDLHAVVARNVVEMVLEAGAADRLLDSEETSADIALSTVEATGRIALVEMRRVLGVLRRPDGPRELEPHPRVAQIDDLIQRHHNRGGLVNFELTGDIRPLPIAVDFAAYHIVEEALETTLAEAFEEFAVTVNFDRDWVDLHVAVSFRGPIAWPTAAMHEWTTLCGGELDASCEHGTWYLTVRLPSRNWQTST